jgi:dTDP-glucose 4,6-dehydratase
MRPRAVGRYEELIEFVSDRPGHDRRYAVSPAKLEQELGWRPHTTFGVGIRQTVHWFLNHEVWARRAGIANVVVDPNCHISHVDLASRAAVQ